MWLVAAVLDSTSLETLMVTDIYRAVTVWQALF